MLAWEIKQANRIYEVTLPKLTVIVNSLHASTRALLASTLQETGGLMIE